MDKKHCIGCESNFYNGTNPLGVKECWSFESAKLENKYVIPVDLRPPYGEHLIKKIPSCYKIWPVFRIGCSPYVANNIMGVDVFPIY